MSDSNSLDNQCNRKRTVDEVDSIQDDVKRIKSDTGSSNDDINSYDGELSHNDQMLTINCIKVNDDFIKSITHETESSQNDMDNDELNRGDAKVTTHDILINYDRMKLTRNEITSSEDNVKTLKSNNGGVKKIGDEIELNVDGMQCDVEDDEKRIKDEFESSHDVKKTINEVELSNDSIIKEETNEESSRHKNNDILTSCSLVGNMSTVRLEVTTDENIAGSLKGHLDKMDTADLHEDFHSMSAPLSWIHKQMLSNANPRLILRHLLEEDACDVPEDLDDLTLWKLIIDLVSEVPRRKKRRDINTLEDAVNLLTTSNKIIVLTGAGVSVSCGIPDFRSRDGIYSRLAVEYPGLPDPQAMFDIQYFRKNPYPFFTFAKEIYPGQFEPSLSHKFIKLLETHEKLLRNYTQNIDTLEQVAGIKNVIQCHGSFAKASCTICKYQCDSEAIRADIMNQVIPLCPRCPPSQGNEVGACSLPPLSAPPGTGIMKPDIVFFGEGLSEEFHQQLDIDKGQCDLLVVIGSSLKVRPVALIPHLLAADVPQILINREPLAHFNFDVELFGDCDVIISELCARLGDGWSPSSRDDDKPLPLLRQVTVGELPSLTAELKKIEKAESGLDDEGCALLDEADRLLQRSSEALAAAEALVAAKLPGSEALNRLSVNGANSNERIEERNAVEKREVCGKREESEENVDSTERVAEVKQKENMEIEREENNVERMDEGYEEIADVETGQETTAVSADESRCGAEVDRKESKMEREKEENKMEVEKNGYNGERRAAECEEIAEVEDGQETTAEAGEQSRCGAEVKRKENEVDVEKNKNNEEREAEECEKIADVEKGHETSAESVNELLCGASNNQKETAVVEVREMESKGNEDVKRAEMKGKTRFQNLSTILEAGTFLFLPSCRYVFSGAEVRIDDLQRFEARTSTSDSKEDDDCDDDYSTTSSDYDISTDTDSRSDDEENSRGDNSKDESDIKALDTVKDSCNDEMHVDSHLEGSNEHGTN